MSTSKPKYGLECPPVECVPKILILIQPYSGQNWTVSGLSATMALGKSFVWRHCELNPFVCCSAKLTQSRLSASHPPAARTSSTIFSRCERRSTDIGGHHVVKYAKK